MSSEVPRVLNEAELKRAIKAAWAEGDAPDVVVISAAGYFAMRASQDGWRRVVWLYWKWGRWPKTKAALRRDLAPSPNDVYASDFGLVKLKVDE